MGTVWLPMAQVAVHYLVASTAGTFWESSAPTAPVLENMLMATQDHALTRPSASRARAEAAARVPTPSFSPRNRGVPGSRPARGRPGSVP